MFSVSPSLFSFQTEQIAKESSILPTAVAGYFVLKCQTVRDRLNNLFCYEPVILIASTAVAIHIIHHFYHKIPNDGKHKAFLSFDVFKDNKY